MPPIDTPTGTPTRNANLDLIRLVASILVLFSHSYPLSGRDSLEPFKAWGFTGGDIAVSTFFVISGYLITASYTRSEGVVDYVRKRAFRIFPALFCAVIFALVLGAFITSLPLQWYLTDPQTIAYLKNIYFDIHYHLPSVFAENVYPSAVNGSLWTLPIEVFMYGLVLLFGLMGALRTSYVVVIVGTALALYITLISYPEMGSVIFLSAASFFTAKLAVFFFMGALLYLQRGRVKYYGWLALVFVVLILASRGHVMQQYLYMLLLPYVVFYCAQTKIPFVDKLTRHGDFSYGIYVYAFPVQQLVSYWFGTDISLLSFFTISLAITLTLSVLSWKYVEKPALNYMRSSNARPNIQFG